MSAFKYASKSGKGAAVTSRHWQVEENGEYLQWLYPAQTIPLQHFALALKLSLHIWAWHFHWMKSGRKGEISWTKDRKFQLSRCYLWIDYDWLVLMPEWISLSGFWPCWSKLPPIFLFSPSFDLKKSLIKHMYMVFFTTERLHWLRHKRESAIHTVVWTIWP